MAGYRIGVDVGGTHTDIALTDSESRTYRIFKVPSTPHNPALAVLAGVDLALRSGVAPVDVDFFAHGTTATTNALLEMNGAPTGLLVNAGLSAIVEVQSQGRDGWSPFDHFFRRPEPIVRPRRMREIGGRIDWRGCEIEPLDEAAVRAAAKSLVADGVEAVAVCFVFSFMNDSHERRAAEILREEAPGLFVSRSSAVLPRLREWPRFSTTMLNAWLGPVLARYCAQIGEGLDARAISTPRRFLMQSNGGVSPLSADAEVHAVRTLLSGPAAGVRGASWLMGEVQGWRNLVTMDIGGTSCDIAFILSGEPLEQAESVIDGRVVGVPALDIATVAAGGGSIARLEASGLPQVGPRSAGADPGPACYGRGGREPTVTDANLVCGVLDPDDYLGGAARLDVEAARAAIRDRLAEPMGASVSAAATGVLRIVNAHMSDAIRIEAAKKGLDLADFTLAPFGGAGPVHAALVAEDLGVPRVLVPRNPGAFSALGLLCSDVRHDHLRSQMSALDGLDPAHAQAIFDDLAQAARAEIAQEGLDPQALVLARELDMRYGGQGYELRVPLDDLPDPLDAAALIEAGRRFHAQHAAAHGHCAPDAPVEVVSYRLRARVPTSKFRPQPLPPTDPGAPAPPPRKSRRVTLGPARAFEAAIYAREDIAPGWRAAGPLIVQQPDSTTLAPDGWSARCDEWGNLVLERQQEVAR